MAKKILVIVHQKTSDPGRVGRMLRERGYSLDIRCPSQQEELPATLDDHEAVVIFGGPMSANDSETLPFIRTELDWIPIVIASGKPFLGICLGAQLLASALGATVAPHPQGKAEIGYFPVVPVESEHFSRTINFYHWNQEGFELPTGAVLLAAGETFLNQAFRYGETAYGLQFHPEVTREMMKKWTILGAEYLTRTGAQSRDEQMQKQPLHDPAAEAWLEGFLNLWIKA